MVPKTPAFDSSLQLLREGYDFALRRCRELGSDLFEGRLLGKRTLFLRGREAAALFADTQLFTRVKAAPRRLQKTLFGVGGVQGLDGEAHRRRKALFMSIVAPERVAVLRAIADEEWRRAIDRWTREPEVVLFDEVEKILCRAVCRWAGVPLAEREVADRARDLAWLIEGSIMAGPRFWRGRAARRRAEQWAAGEIDRARKSKAPTEQAIFAIAHFRDQDGELLKRSVAAVELLNVLRPTVAVARFIVFEALALHEHPEYARRFAEGDEALADAFIQEVRRYYPFFPMVVAKARRDFEWHGAAFKKGEQVMLDLYGTNHDPHVWSEPEAFWPERFLARKAGPSELIPQGAGEAERGHRCPGESITVELMRGALELLTREMTYEVPPQDLSVRHDRIPAEPESRFVIRGVERR